MLRHLIAGALMAATAPALAETVHCADADGEVAVEYDVSYDAATNKHAVTRVQMQITDDFGISTDPQHEDYDGEDIAEQSVAGGLVSVNLRVSGEGLPALQLRLGTLSDQLHEATAGVLGVSGGGLWVVTCDAPE